MSELDNFYEWYDKPEVSNVIVGFAGIDPMPTGLSLTSRMEAAKNDESEENPTGYLHPLRTQVEDNLTSTSTNKALSANQGRVLKGLIDAVRDNAGSGGGTVTLANHEQLDGLLGGDENGHYHLSPEDLKTLKNVFIAIEKASLPYPPNADFPNYIIVHHKLLGVTGGRVIDDAFFSEPRRGAYVIPPYVWHLNPGEYESLTKLLSLITQKDETYSEPDPQTLEQGLNDYIDARIAEYMANHS